MIVIPYVEKTGVIISLQKHKHTYRFTIFWQYKNGETDIAVVDQQTISLWLSRQEGISKDNLNYYIPVPK
jgi:hypothetical protein